MAKILDVGSGHKPRGGVNLDINPRLKPTVVGDACHLPFRDNVFSVVFASHLIEHVVDPDETVKEFLRVSRKAVLRFPKPKNISQGKYYLKMLAINWWSPIEIYRIVNGIRRVQRSSWDVHKHIITLDFLRKYGRIIKVRNCGSFIGQPLRRILSKRIMLFPTPSYEVVLKK